MNAILEGMFETGTVQTDDGQSLPFHSGVSYQQANLLQRIAAAEPVATTLEIGLAYGTSALAIIEGKTKHNSVGKQVHIAIDPHQSTSWHNVGISNMRRAGFEANFELIENYDHLSLTRLLEIGQTVDLAFIDGWHTFDATFVDAFYIDKMLCVGGVMIFHDYTLPGVNRAVSWLQSHRSYVSCPQYEDRRSYLRRFASYGARLRSNHFLGQTGTSAALARTHMPVLRKMRETDSDDWAYYRHF